MRLVSTLVLLSAIACGGGGGGSTPAPAPAPLTPPGISNFAYTTASTWTVGSGGGAATGGFKFDFIDTGGDLASLVMERLDGGGNVTKSSTTAISGASGLTSGTISVAVIADTTIAGTVNWRFHVVDARGSVSNTLNSSYTITPSAPPPSPALQAPPDGFIQSAEAMPKE